jgi:hypothetical protein
MKICMWQIMLLILADIACAFIVLLWFAGAIKI